MGIYDVNFRKFAGGLLPGVLRGTVLDWVLVLIQPFKSLHHRFMQYREDKLRALRYDATTVRLEAMLNDYLHNELVEDGAAVLPCVVYSELEHLPVMVGMQIIHSYTAWGAVPFVVKIPAVLQGNQDVWNRVDRLVRRYKLLGTKHTIEYYQD